MATQRQMNTRWHVDLRICALLALSWWGIAGALASADPPPVIDRQQTERIARALEQQAAALRDVARSLQAQERCR